VRRSLIVPYATTVDAERRWAYHGSLPSPLRKTADGERRAMHATFFDHHQALTNALCHRAIIQTTQDINFVRVTPNRTDISVSLLKQPTNAYATTGLKVAKQVFQIAL
jgi:hypothetical protein